MSATDDLRRASDRDIHFVLGEIVGTQRQILKIVEDNAAAIVDQNKRIDIHREHTIREFEENKQRTLDLDDKLTARYEKNVERIDGVETEIVRTKGIMKGALWVVGLVIPTVTWLLRKIEII